MGEPTTLLKSRFLDVGRQGGALTFSFTRCFEEALGLNLRRREAHRVAISALKSVGSVSWLAEGRVLIFNGEDLATADVATALNKIDRRLEKIATRPLSAGMVERALGITARERLRWTKDGRLARVGTNLIRRGQLIALSTYAVREIAHLMDERETIRIWREVDDRGRHEA
jgi:hypothetical protein